MKNNVQMFPLRCFIHFFPLNKYKGEREQTWQKKNQHNNCFQYSFAHNIRSFFMKNNNSCFLHGWWAPTIMADALSWCCYTIISLPFEENYNNVGSSSSVYTNTNKEWALLIRILIWQHCNSFNCQSYKWRLLLNDLFETYMLFATFEKCIYFEFKLFGVSKCQHMGWTPKQYICSVQIMIFMSIQEIKSCCVYVPKP